MPDVYLDASALVKAYVVEPGSGVMARYFKMEDVRLTTSRVVVAEVVSAMVRRFRSGEIEASQLASMRQDFARDCEEIDLVDVAPDVSDLCPGIVDAHGLRALDAIHLATACLIAGAAPEGRGGWTFLCSDGALLAAARAEGFDVVDPAAAG